MRAPASSQAVSLADAMAFAGPGPEKINGRLSMLAVVAALGAELSSHETVAKQLSEQPTLIVLAAVLVAAGSLVPLLEGKAVEQSKGFWNSAAEQTNGRAASASHSCLRHAFARVAYALPRCSDWLRLAARDREAGGPRAAVSAPPPRSHAPPHTHRCFSVTHYALARLDVPARSADTR